MRSLVSRSMTSVVAAPPADAEGDAPGEPLVPGVPAGAQAAASTSAMARKIDEWRKDMVVALPLRVVDEPSTGSFGLEKEPEDTNGPRAVSFGTQASV